MIYLSIVPARCMPAHQKLMTGTLETTDVAGIQSQTAPAKRMRAVRWFLNDALESHGGGPACVGAKRWESPANMGDSNLPTATVGARLPSDFRPSDQPTLAAIPADNGGV